MADLTQAGEAGQASVALIVCWLPTKDYYNLRQRFTLEQSTYHTLVFSPIYGDFICFRLFSSWQEHAIYFYDAVRLHRKIRDFNGTSQFEIVEGPFHAEYLIAHETPESYMTYDELRHFSYSISSSILQTILLQNTFSQ